jgi:phosphoribosylglycinamide formyltransferase-1
MKILILTYNHQHRKTQDLLLRMKALGYKGLIVLGTKWEDRQNFAPILKHRPSETIPVCPEEFCRNLDYEYLSGHITRAEEINPDLILIAGSGILPGALVNHFPAINCHPGYLPYCRGLDALKWGLLEGVPIGVTLHRVAPEVDAGTLISQVETQIYFGDTFHSIARRHYEAEINLLALAPDFDCRAGTKIDVTGQAVHRRMPHAVEIVLMQRIESMVKNKLPEDLQFSHLTE